MYQLTASTSIINYNEIRSNGKLRVTLTKAKKKKRKKIERFILAETNQMKKDKPRIHLDEYFINYHAKIQKLISKKSLFYSKMRIRCKLSKYNIFVG